MCIQEMGMIFEGNAANEAGKFNYAVSQRNKKIADERADDARQRGKIESENHARFVEQTKGAQRAGIAASNVIVDEGSALDIVSDTAEFGKLDELTILNNAEREAYNYQVDGMNALAQGSLAKANGKNAQTASYYQAAGSLTSKAAKAATGGAG